MLDTIDTIAIYKLIGMIFLFLILFMLVGLIIKKRLSANKPVVAPRIMRYLLLPTALAYGIFILIFKFSQDHGLMKITETILIIFGISFFLNMVNHLFFSKDNIITGKASIPKLARDIIHFLLISLASTFVLSRIWGFDLGNLLAALGVGSFVIGLALQEPLGNLFNGIALLIAKPFEKGDWIEIGDDTGKIVDFNWRSAKLINRYNEMIIIPNNILAKERFKNLSRPNKIHAELVEVGFSYDDHPIKVKEALVEIALASKHVLTMPKPVALVLAYDDFYINYGLKFFINDYADQILLKDEMMTNIYTATKEKGFTIPFPIQEVHYKNKTDKN